MRYLLTKQLQFRKSKKSRWRIEWESNRYSTLEEINGCIHNKLWSDEVGSSQTWTNLNNGVEIISNAPNGLERLIYRFTETEQTSKT